MSTKFRSSTVANYSIHRLSYFYTSKELPIRLSFFWTALDLTQIVTSIMAFGLLRMRGIHGLEGWRWYLCSVLVVTLSAADVSQAFPCRGTHHSGRRGLRHISYAFLSRSYQDVVPS